MSNVGKFGSVVVTLCVVLAPTSSSAQEQAQSAPLAHFRFAAKAKNEGKGTATFDLKNTEFKDDALYLNGKFGYGGEVAYRAVCKTPALDYSTFTVALRFKAEDFTPYQINKITATKTNLLTGGILYRWFGMNRSQAGNLVVTLNNQAFAYEIKGAALEKGKWTMVACAVDLPNHKITVCLNGKKVAEIAIPKDFKLTIIDAKEKESEKVWSFTNHSNGNVFHGLVDELLIFDRVLPAKEMEKITLRKR